MNVPSALLGMLRAVSFTDVVDVAMVTLLLWVLIRWLRATRARAALLGVLTLGGIYLLSRQMGLSLTAWILQGFVAASLIVVVVVFQEDIRRLFEQIGQLGRRRRGLAVVADAVDTLTRALVQLADQRRGALIVIPGRDPLERHLEGGVRLDARLSEPLLLSLFDPHSPGHDGAAILGSERVARFAVHLPLSTDHVQLGQRGTRHAAALGLAERSDALCLVVSEERGTVSVAREGTLRTLARPELAGDELRRFFAALGPEGAEGSPGGRWRLTTLPREGAAALAAALLLWLLAVPGAGTVELERIARVVVEDLPAGYVVEAIEPGEVQVTLSALRRDLFRVERFPVEVRLNTVLVRLGRRTFPVTPEQVSHPVRTEVLGIAPDTVKLSVRKEDTAKP